MGTKFLSVLDWPRRGVPISIQKTDEDKAMVAEGMQIYNDYFLGGVEVLYEQFVNECVDRDQYLNRMYQYTKRFNEEQDGDALKADIDKILNN